MYGARLFVGRKCLSEERLTIEVSDLIVFTEVILEFEQVHGLGKPAQLPKPDEAKEIHKSKERTYLELIALMAVELGVPLDNPNRAHTMLEFMRSKHRMELCSDETLRKHFNLITETINLPKVSK